MLVQGSLTLGVYLRDAKWYLPFAVQTPRLPCCPRENKLNLQRLLEGVHPIEHKLPHYHQETWDAMVRILLCNSAYDAKSRFSGQLTKSMRLEHVPGLLVYPLENFYVCLVLEKAGLKIGWGVRISRSSDIAP